MAIRPKAWSASADKHGPHEDALHAIEHAVYVEVEFDEPRLGGRVRPTLFIGPPRAGGGALLEVMVEITGVRGVHIPRDGARKKHLDRMGEN